MICKFSNFPDGLLGKESAYNAGDTDVGLIPGLGGFSGEENGNQLQYSCLENPMDRGAWRATVHGVAKSGMTEHTCSLSCCWVWVIVLPPCRPICLSI